MQRRTLLKTTALVAVASMSIVGAAWAENPHLKIGFVGVTSGPATAWGISNQRSMEARAAWLNETGGVKIGDMTYKVHLDGYNLVPHLTGQAAKSPRESFLYVNDDQQVVGLRYDNWKIVFMEQRANGQLLLWANPFTNLRVPKIFNLRTDPYERADITSNTYYDWLFDHVFLLVPAQDYVAQFLGTFRDYPQRQKAASFNLDEVLAKLKEAN